MHVFSWLDARTLGAVARVCREWRLVVRSPRLWRRVELSHGQISSQFLQRLARRCAKAEVLILEDLLPRHRRRDESIEDYHENIRWSLEPGLDCLLKKAEATLHTVTIINCGMLLSAKSIWAASVSCRRLRHVTYLSDQDAVNQEVMWALGSGCRDLHTLRIHPIFPCTAAERFTTRCAQMIGQCFQDLRTLSLGGQHVDVSALEFIVSRCQKLERLELHRIRFLSCELVDRMCQGGLADLQELAFYGTPVAIGAIPLFNSRCAHLRRIMLTLKEEDHVTDGEEVTSLPEYEDLVDGYKELQKSAALRSKLQLDVARPKVKKEAPKITEPEEKSFFQRLFS